VVCAHIDAKMGSPGAIDNASGVIVLLLLAEMLQGASSNLGLEIVAFNGEDYFAAPGQIEYLAQSSARLPKIRLAINLDGPGYVEGASAYSMYECPANLEQTAKEIFSRYTGIEEGEPWVQSDHSIFIQRGVPAMAITSEHFMELSAQVTHTEKDQPNLLDPIKLVEIGQALCEVLLALDQR
jgi:aminopeptidase YwaD